MYFLVDDYESSLIIDTTSDIINTAHIVQHTEFSTISLLTLLLRILCIDDITPIVKQMIANTVNTITINITPLLILII